MPTTPKLALPYPVPGDPADVPTDMGELAVAVDAKAASANGLATLGADGKVPAAQLPAQAPSSIISSALGAGVHRLQAGISDAFADANGQVAVAFPVAFSNATVFVVLGRRLGGSTPVPWLVSVNAAGFVYGWLGAGLGDGTVIDWMAVGLA